MDLSARLSAAREGLAAHGQEHVLRFAADLDSEAAARLLDQVEQLDLEWLRRVLATEETTVDPGAIRPCQDVVRLGHPDEERALAAGREALAAGKVAVLLVAGGSGSRLGFDGPKGAFPIGPVSGRTLFQVHVEQVLAEARGGGAVPPLFIMTSEYNDAETRRLLEEAGNFGLPDERLFIFTQGMAPAVDEQGKLLLAAKDQLVRAPNGNGGLFAALAGSGALARMERLGVEAISYIQVDNPLSPGCDPRFVGFHLLRGSDYSCKGIAKRDPAEKVGSYAQVDGRLRVVEYYELPEELARQQGEDGELLFGLSNPGMFLWSRRFAEAQAARQDLPFHRAHKKIPHLDAGGRRLEPAEPNGYKLECFAMDTLPDAERTLLLAVDRAREFAPVKNARGEDSPDTAREQMVALHRQWLLAAGVDLHDPRAQVEISPLYARDAAELRGRLPAGFSVDGDLYLKP